MKLLDVLFLLGVIGFIASAVLITEFASQRAELIAGVLIILSATLCVIPYFTYRTKALKK